MGSDPDDNARARAVVTQFVNPLSARGDTAIYSSVRQALIELSQERGQATDKRYYTVVLMTDGENNDRLTHGIQRLVQRQRPGCSRHPRVPHFVRRGQRARTG